MPGSTGPATTTPYASSTPAAARSHRCTIEHTDAGLRDLAAVLAPARRRRGGHRTTRRARRRRPARRRADRGGDQPQPGQEPARPLRLGRQQGRPVRRLRAGRHAAHRPGPAAAAGPRQPRPPSRCAATCRARKDLVAHRVAVANQLRAHLRNVFPGAVGLFADIDSPISLAFLARFDCQDRADWLTPKRLGAWLARWLLRPHRPRRAARPADRRTPRRHRRPRHRRKRTSPAPAGRAAHPGRPDQALSEQIDEQLAAHADAHIFTSLPRSGHRPRRPAARRDRRLPRPLPHPAVPVLRNRASLSPRRSTLNKSALLAAWRGGVVAEVTIWHNRSRQRYKRISASKLCRCGPRLCSRPSASSTRSVDRFRVARRLHDFRARWRQPASLEAVTHD